MPVNKSRKQKPLYMAILNAINIGLSEVFMIVFTYTFFVIGVLYLFLFILKRRVMYNVKKRMIRFLISNEIIDVDETSIESTIKKYPELDDFIIAMIRMIFISDKSRVCAKDLSKSSVEIENIFREGHDCNFSINNDNIENPNQLKNVLFTIKDPGYFSDPFIPRRKNNNIYFVKKFLSPTDEGYDIHQSNTKYTITDGSQQQIKLVLDIRNITHNSPSSDSDTLAVLENLQCIKNYQICRVNDEYCWMDNPMFKLFLSPETASLVILAHQIMKCFNLYTIQEIKGRDTDEATKLTIYCSYRVNGAKLKMYDPTCALHEIDKTDVTITKFVDAFVKNIIEALKPPNNCDGIVFRNKHGLKAILLDPYMVYSLEMYLTKSAPAK